MRYLPVFALLLFAQTAHAQWPTDARSSTPHPAVVRVVAPERDGTAYGSGTLIDLRDEYGLILTNWHVVCNAAGPIEVRFPSGFVSQARALKMDSDWDLAALVVWRPPCEPVRLASSPPRPGDRLTICGYGSGQYRAITGRCTQFYAPRLELPQELVELDVQARQGDSGGPIFNERGELAGVLFGAGQGTTLGSFEGRVKTFLASLAPDIGAADNAPQVALKPSHSSCPTCPNNRGGVTCQGGVCRPRSDLGDVCFGCDTVAGHGAKSKNTDGLLPDVEQDDWPQPPKMPPPHWTAGTDNPAASSDGPWPSSERQPSTAPAATAAPIPAPILSSGLFENVKNGLAVVGLLAIGMQLLRLVG